MVSDTHSSQPVFSAFAECSLELCAIRGRRKGSRSRKRGVGTRQNQVQKVGAGSRRAVVIVDCLSQHTHRRKSQKKNFDLTLSSLFEYKA
jgi:hypothetical protein